jgi:hypothetical protein
MTPPPTHRQSLRESLKVRPKDVVHSAAALVSRVRNSVTRRRGSSMVDRAVDHKESKAWEEVRREGLPYVISCCVMFCCVCV